MEVLKLRIINLGEASSASDNDYIMLSSPTLGERKIKISNMVSVGGLINIDMDDYEQLTPQEIANNDYYIPDYYNEISSDFPLFGTGTALVEASMTAVEAPSAKTVNTTYLGGVYIGCNMQYRNGLDITNVNAITFDLRLEDCYSGSPQTNPQWYYTVGLLPSAPSGFISADNSSFLASKKYSNGYTTYSNQSIDTSLMSGIVYPIIIAHGWNSILSNFKIVTGYSGEAISKHGDIFVPV